MLPPGFRRCRPGIGLQRPYYDVQGPTIHGPLYCTLLADQILIGNAHYIAEARRHIPCPGDGCPWCLSGRGKRRKGYIAAITTRSRQKFVLELTDAALNQLEKWMEQGTPLRGLKLKLERRQSKKGDRSKTAMVLLTFEGDATTENLPEAFDEVPHLEKMWGMRDDHEPPAPALVGRPTPPPSSGWGAELSPDADLKDGL